MKFTGSFLVSVILATCVSSLPLSKRSMNMGGSKGFAAGAAYCKSSLSRHFFFSLLTLHV